MAPILFMGSLNMPCPEKRETIICMRMVSSNDI